MVWTPAANREWHTDLQKTLCWYAISLSAWSGYGSALTSTILVNDEIILSKLGIGDLFLLSAKTPIHPYFIQPQSLLGWSLFIMWYSNPGWRNNYLQIVDQRSLPSFVTYSIFHLTPILFRGGHFLSRDILITFRETFFPRFTKSAYVFFFFFFRRWKIFPRLFFNFPFAPSLSSCLSYPFNPSTETTCYNLTFAKKSPKQFIIRFWCFFIF